MRDRELAVPQLELIAARFRVLGEPSRLRLLQVLRAGERSVTELCAATQLTQANVSKHLQLLFAAGYVARRREGLTTRYALADADVLQLCEVMCGRLERELLERQAALGTAPAPRRR
ncbi:MAG: metalloregulator ArsR/SmtB family transcription factor [Gemmatimonadales bacterium]|nr:metalloregulator ArsR/SmtB family transcription factor [Gemmatimonadales bacterium]